MRPAEAIAAMERVRADKVKQIDRLTRYILAASGLGAKAPLETAVRELCHEELAAIDYSLDLMMKARLVST